MMETNVIIQGDAWHLAKRLEPNSISLICTSPPYFSQRDYQTGQWEGGSAECDHLAPGKRGTRNNGRNRAASGGTFHDSPKIEPDLIMQYRGLCGKCGARRIDQQAGLEATPGEFIAKLVTLFRDLRTALHPTGQCFINISDTRSDSREWLGIPHRLVFALQADGWRYEDEIIWEKRNCMPSSQTNRFTRSHEMVFMLNKSRDAYFDAEAVKEAANPATQRSKPVNATEAIGNTGGNKRTDFEKNRHVVCERNKRTVWSIPTQPLAMPHYAAYPEALVRPMIEAGSSARGICPNCLAPYLRVVEKPDMSERPTRSNHAKYPTNGNHFSDDGGGTLKSAGQAYQEWRNANPDVTTGWAASCTCSAGPPIPATVLDPFLGSGTSACVAVSLGRRYVGFELNEQYCEMARQRIAATQPALLAL